jgi:hypothetical protein
MAPVQLILALPGSNHNSKKLGYVPERDEELETIRPSFQVRTADSSAVLRFGVALLDCDAFVVFFCVKFSISEPWF